MVRAFLASFVKIRATFESNAGSTLRGGQTERKERNCNEWIIGSGATWHIASNRDLFDNFDAS